MSRSLRLVRVVSVILAATLFAALWLARPSASLADGERFRAAWEQARRAGSYRFNADIEQTLTPRPLPELIGQTEQQVTLLAQGDVQLPGRARLQLQLSQGLTSIPPITLIQQGDQAFIQKGDKLELVQNPVGAVAPTADFMAYLAAADNVRLVDTGPLPRSQSPELFTRYAFDVNGSRFADYLRAQLQERVQREVGATVTIAVPDQLKRLSGQGELWVDSQGFPRRQTLTLAIPQTTDAYDARATLVMDFRDFGQGVALPQPIQGADGAWRLTEAAPPAGTAGEPSSSSVLRIAYSLFPIPSVILLLGVGGFMVAIVRVRRRRRAMYAGIVTLTIISMVGGPLLQVTRLIDFTDRQAQAASAKTVTEALGLESAGADAKGELLPGVAGPLAQQTSGSTAQRVAACGDGSDGVDSDNDGLSDRVENCLGTDPYNDDTDGDGLKDGVEVAGFQYQGQTWYGDPLRVDSNGDSRSDLEEWPQAAGGRSAVVDTDNDGIPDLWDRDDDGDGVDDSIDLSPTTTTAYVPSFDLHTQNANFDGGQYIELQLQPESISYLRAVMGRFDWPNDDKGTITDLNQSTDDMRLLPVLQVDTTVAPDADSAQRYGVSVLRDGSLTRLIIPLAVASANQTSGGGVTQYDRVQAFYAKVGYGPGQQADIQWTNAKLVWMVQATLDRYVNCADPDAPNTVTCRIDSGSNVIQTYEDRFRVTGLRITKSRAFEVGVFGTPQFPTEDQQVFQFNLALAGLFMSKDTLPTQPSNETFLQEVERRFTSPNTPTDLRWGLADTTTVAVSRTVYTHHDAGVAGLSAAVQSFLNANYPDSAYASGRCADSAGNQFKCATLALAFEEQMGVAGLDDLTAVGTQGFYSNLGDVPLTTGRSWRMAGYESAGGQWQTMSPARVIDVMNSRYSGAALQAMLAEAQPTYPLLTLADMRYLTYLTYSSVLTGASKVVKVGELHLLLDQGIENQIISVVKLTAARTPTYFGGVFGATRYLNNLRSSLQTLNSIREPDEMPGAWAEQNAYLRSQTYWARTGQVATVVSGILLAGAVILQAVQQACLDRNAPPGTPPRDTCGLDQHAIKIASITIGALQQVTAAVTLIVTIKGFTQAGAEATQTVGSLAASFKAAGTMAKGMAIVGLLVQLGVIWTVFGLAVAGGASPGSIAFNMALATAIVSTIVALIFFALAFVPGVNIVVALIGLIDGIVSLATNGRFSITGYIIQGLVKAFYDVSILANITGIASDGPTTSLTGPKSGLVQGNNFVYTDTYHTSFTGGRVSQSDANAWMEFRGSVPGGGATVGAAPVNQGAVRCEEQGGGVEVPSPFGAIRTRASLCTNNAGVSFRLGTARPNVELKVEALLHYTIPYKECSLGICGSTKHERGTSDPSSFSLYVDVLPPTLDGFWLFTPLTNNPLHTFNLDTDGDGLPNALENGIGTDPSNWDSDGDGLSDGFEYYNRDTLGTNPKLKDSDGDGLNDGDELRYGTSVRVADTDGDGLLDGQEVCRVELQNGTPVQLGGWNAQVFGATVSMVHVCSDPLSPDSDGDGLTDRLEKDQALSPYARNGSPQLTITGRPLSIGPDGQRGIYVKPGERITPTLELASTGAFPVTQTLQVCLAGVLTGIGGGALQGVSQPPPRSGPTAGCGGAGSQGFAWPFNNTTNRLQLMQVVSATFTSQAVAAATSTTGTLQSSVVYSGRTMTDRVDVIVDADNPTVQITAPVNGAVLRGTSFVVGGIADDPTSWVSGVEVKVDSGAYQPATGSRNWAWTWSSPPDGNHLLTARATDYLGHTAPQAVNVMVDNTAPTVTLTPSGGVTLNGVIYVRPGTGTNTVALGGTASDALSGVAQVQISLDRQPWRDVSLTSGTWSFNWELTSDAQGSHRVQVRAFDVAGNESTPAAQILIVDAVPPTDDLTSPDLTTLEEGGYPLEVKAGAALTVYGRANDAGRVPLPSRPVPLTGPDPINTVNQATVWLQPPSPNDYDGGINALWLGDVNGDGRGDLAVGLPSANASAGGVYVVQGRGGNWPILPNAEALADAALIYSGAPGAGIGGIVASAGDVDGDGRYDLLIGDAANGRVFLVFGRASNVSRNIDLTGPRSGDWQVLTLPAGATLRQVAAAGDVNGDGFGDVLIRTSDTVYLLLGHSGVWDATLAVTTEAAARLTVGATAQATGVGDADGVQVGGKSFGDFVVTDPANTLGGGSAVYL
ncbi:MAG: FG-GAP repeat protein, partial [Anaerolineae bacterium]|nr:FG-GAP repeat protein [Anaerolineae bacterium]